MEKKKEKEKSQYYLALVCMDDGRDHLDLFFDDIVFHFYLDIPR